MQITKTINVVQEGELEISNEMTIDFRKNIILIGVKFNNEHFSCEAAFEEIKTGFTGTQIDTVNDFVNKARRIAINSKIEPDTSLTDQDFEDEI